MRYHFLDTKCEELEAGVDEAGRGALAGPVVAAAVVWHPDVDARNIRDSKRLSAKMRAELRTYIEHHAIAYSVAFIPNTRIDEVNIYQATFDAMHNALDGLGVEVDRILVDGSSFRPYGTSPQCHVCIEGGDDKYVSIGAASILAKEHRDEYMSRVAATEFPTYGWDVNKGYGTQKHIDAIQEYGVTRLHRKTFRKVKLDNESFGFVI